MDDATKEMRLIELDISNFNGYIDNRISESLKNEEGLVYADHAALNYFGKIWFKDGKFYEQIWKYREIVDVISANSLEELIKAVCEKHGYE